MDGRRARRSAHAQDHTKVAEHVHIHQEHRRVHGAAGDQGPRHTVLDCATVHNMRGVARAPSRLDRQLQRADGALSGLRQRPTPHHDRPQGRRRRRHTGRHARQLDHRDRLVCGQEPQQEPPGVQLHLRTDQSNHVGRDGGHDEAQDLRLSVRQHCHVSRSALHPSPSCQGSAHPVRAAHTRLHHGLFPQVLQQEEHLLLCSHTEKDHQVDKRARVLYHTRVGVHQREPVLSQASTQFDR